ncbi:hypothetical protein [Micromonospora psammae]|uniref:hypothetical protein n=1 Tax=Micromonospora sp. CPCC 205556 TaxID=3122398 RepID=UPI002FF02F9D
MRETDLNDVFAEFEARTAPTFRPPGLATAQHRVRNRRRHRRALLAGVAALLLAGPGGVYAVAGRDGDRTSPTPAPSPTASPSPGGPPVARRIAVPGVTGEVRDLRFVDSRHGWALFDTCDARAFTDCRRALARTEDGGVTWRKTALPATANRPTPGGPPRLEVVDGRRLTVAVDLRYLVTTDGGASFTEHPVTAPPSTTQLAWATRSGFSLRCPGTNARTGPAGNGGCPRPDLVRIGQGTVAAQPPVNLGTDLDGQLIESGDGRLWATVREGAGMTVVVSDDRAATWRKLPTVPGARRLLVSPDGAHAWAVDIDQSDYSGSAGKRVWALDGDRWRERIGLPDDTVTVEAVNAGFLAVTGAYGTAGFWTPAGYVDSGEVRGSLRGGSEESMSVEVLPDDTVVLHQPGAWIIGVGTGPQRVWTRIS